MNRTIPCDAHAPAAARKHAAEVLGGPGVSAAVVNDVVLVVSELVTNAVEAGATSIELGIDIAQHQITVSVGDDTGGWPMLTRPGRYATHGRGLAIIAAMAENWEVQRTGDGKKVTATFATHSRRA